MQLLTDIVSMHYKQAYHWRLILLFCLPIFLNNNNLHSRLVEIYYKVYCFEIIVSKILIEKIAPSVSPDYKLRYMVK